MKGETKKVHLTFSPFLIVFRRSKLVSFIDIYAELNVLENVCLIEITKNALTRAPLLGWGWGGEAVSARSAGFSR